LRAGAGVRMDRPSRRVFSSRAPRRALAGAALLVVFIVACDRPAAEEIVVYTSVDQPFAQAILRDFEAQTGLRVAAVYDSEAGKNTGLVRRLQREQQRPLCDVWWSSEAFGTIELARADLLEPFENSAAADIPAEWKDVRGRWVGVAARARVLVWDARRRDDSAVQTWSELRGDPLKRLALANPHFGTTRGHVASLFAAHGPIAGQEFAHELRDAGSLLADGNAHAVRLVQAGQADACWTDSDDLWAARRNGAELAFSLPAVAADPPWNTPLWIPCTVAVVRGAPHAAAARRLAEFLVSARVEEALARSDSHNVPVREALRQRLSTDPAVADFMSLGRPVAPPFDAITDALPAAMNAVQETLLR
jgi:iron(III) transport system substrate-binding protein